MKEIKHIVAIGDVHIRGTEDHMVLSDVLRLFGIKRTASHASLYIPKAMRWTETVLLDYEPRIIWLCLPEVFDHLIALHESGFEIPSEAEEKKVFLEGWISRYVSPINPACNPHDWIRIKHLYDLYDEIAEIRGGVGAVTLPIFKEALKNRGYEFGEEATTANISLTIHPTILPI